MNNTVKNNDSSSNPSIRLDHSINGSVFIRTEEYIYLSIIPSTKFGNAKACYLLPANKLDNNKFELVEANGIHNLEHNEFFTNFDAIEDENGTVVVRIDRLNKQNNFLEKLLSCNSNGVLVVLANGKNVTDDKFYNNVKKIDAKVAQFNSEWESKNNTNYTSANYQITLTPDFCKVFDRYFFNKENNKELMDKIKNDYNSANQNKISNILCLPITNFVECNRSNSIKFAIGSCQFPAGIFDKKIANASYARLDKEIDKDNLDFLILTGDQVYVDASAGLFDPATKSDRYDLPYRKFFNQPHVKNVFKKLPVHMMLDDHEINNNWEPKSDSHTNIDSVDLSEISNIKEFKEVLESKYYKDGIQSYIGFQRPDLLFKQKDILSPLKYLPSHENILANVPDAILKDNCSGEEIDLYAKAISAYSKRVHKPEFEKLWYGFSENSIPIFMLDSRTQRTVRSESSTKESCILSDQQFDDLIAWMDNKPLKPKLIVSPSVILPRDTIVANAGYDSPTVLRSDSWSGYPFSVRKLLSTIVEHEVRNVVFLAGDKHISCVSKIKIYEKNTGNDDMPEPIIIHSIVSSGMYAPFTFANTKIEDLAIVDDFDFKFISKGKERIFHCSVEPVKFKTSNGDSVDNGFAPGDGFAIISLEEKKSNQWKLDFKFNRAELNYVGNFVLA